MTLETHEKQEEKLGQMIMTKRVYESLFKFPSQKYMIRDGNNLSKELNDLGIEYSFLRKEAIKLGMDISGLPKELNYMQMQN